MPSFRQALLDRAGPLDDFEVGILGEWLQALREDVAAFGPTPEDEARIAAISDRIARARPEAAAT